MSRTNTRLLQAALRALRGTRTDTLAAPLTGGVGAIFMLHHVTPHANEGFAPNRILSLTPGFLESVVDQVREWGYDIVALDDIPERIASAEGRPPFVSFTFDDGYRDNRDHAYPIFRKRGLPMAVYVPSDFADGNGDLWWLALEGAIRAAEHVSCEVGGKLYDFAARNDKEKEIAFHGLYWALRQVPEDDARSIVSGLAQRAGFDPSDLCRKLVMSWDELRAFADDPLVTIGAHTTGHYALAKLPLQRAREEMADSVNRVEAELGRPCRHFSYPYGSDSAAGEREFSLARELGLRTAVTTRKGLIRPGHATQLTALPRVSLNGDFQELGFVRTLLSGLPFALMDVCKQASRIGSLGITARS